MTTDYIDHHLAAADKRIHDAILGLAVAVIFVLPLTLAAFVYL